MTFKIQISRHAKVFVLEDSEARIAWFKDKLPSITVARTVDEAIATLALHTFDFVFLDHDLGLLDSHGRPGPEGTGKQVAKFLSGRNYLANNVVIHSWNPVGAAAMKDILIGAAAIPFGRFEIEFSD